MAYPRDTPDSFSSSKRAVRSLGFFSAQAVFLLTLLAFSGLSLALGGCASVSIDQPLNRRQLDAVLDQEGIDPRRVVMPYELTDEMRRWAHEAVAERALPFERLLALRARLLDSEELPVRYVWGYTGTAAEVFHNRQANCLAFTNLFLGMAREVGVPVYFLAVDNVQSFRKDGDLVIVSDHIAVGYGEPSNRRIFDFSEDLIADPRFVRRISDLSAIAMFHSNRGAEALQRGAIDEARAWLRVSVETDPRLASAWVNLGVAERRLGANEAAETAYRRALELAPGHDSAAQNLVSLLYSLDRSGEAASYRRALIGASTQNPYTYLSLGDISLRSGRPDEARRFYRRAAHLARSAESYAALGQAEAASGDLREARKMLRRAQQAGEACPRVLALASLLSGQS